jgi:hypothetical protein
MIRYNFIISMLLASAMFFAGCDENKATDSQEPQLVVTSNGYEFGQTKGNVVVDMFTHTVTIDVETPYATSQWSANAIYPDRVEPFLSLADNTEKTGNGKFSISFSRNTVGSNRNATVTVTCRMSSGDKTFVINILQQSYLLKVAPKEALVDQSAQQVDFAVSIEPAMSLRYVSDSDWAQPIEGEGAKFNVAAYDSQDNRTAVISVYPTSDPEFLLGSFTITQQYGILESDFTLTVPFKANVYVTPKDPNSKETPQAHSSIISNSSGTEKDGEMPSTTSWLKSYDSQNLQLSFFFRTEYTGELLLGIVSQMGTSAMSATLKVTIEDISHEVTVSGNELKTYSVGRFNVSKKGYVRVNIEGVSASGNYYPYITGFKLGGAAINNVSQKSRMVVFVTDAETHTDDIRAVHWIRRGPSCHLWFTQPAGDIEYFYNEVTIPEGCDIQGSYYMTTGFSNGYMGVQPPSTVLFSTWDTNTANGDLVELVRWGEHVDKPNRFGHEGSGLQCFLKGRTIVANRTYATLVKICPDTTPEYAGWTTYTGYFYDPADEKWHLIAEYRRPKETIYYKGAYAFSENFAPEKGWIPRKAVFTNQWMRDNKGVWREVVQARVTADGTGSNDIRRDWTGGVDANGNFYLENIGYIDASATYGQIYERTASGGNPPLTQEQLNALEELGQRD